MAKIKGYANPGKGGPCTLEIDGVLLDPGPSQAMIHHSDDFSWGFGGSGAAQSALAIMLHHTKDKQKALAWYQTFKWDVVAKWPFGGSFSVDIDIDGWIQNQIDFQDARYPIRNGEK